MLWMPSVEVGGDLLLVAGLGVHDEPLAGAGPWVVGGRLVDGLGRLGILDGDVEDDRFGVVAGVETERGGLVGRLVVLEVVARHDFERFDLGCRGVAVVGDWLGHRLVERRLLGDRLVDLVRRLVDVVGRAELRLEFDLVVLALVSIGDIAFGEPGLGLVGLGLVGLGLVGLGLVLDQAGQVGEVGEGSVL